MVQKGSQNSHAKSAKMAADKWLDLPNGPLVQIFNNLSPIELLLVVPLVFKSWGRILCEIIFRKENNNNILDFRPLYSTEKFWRIFYRMGSWNSRAANLMKLLVGVTHAFASGGESDAVTCASRATPITNIIFPHGLPLFDRRLVYIAKRCSELKSICLPWAENITGRGITRAMTFWTGTEEMTYGPFCYPPLYDRHLFSTIEEIIINCKHLRFLQLNCFDLDWQSADIIGWDLKSLKSLCLYGVFVHKYGLQIFLSRCKKLDEIKFICCFFVKSGGMKFAGEIKITRIQEGCKTRWTDKCPAEISKLHTSKELVDLLWE